MFLGSHFLFTSSDTFAELCIIQPQHTVKNWTAKNFQVWNNHRQRVIWPWLFQMRHFWWFGSATIPYIVCSMISLLSDSYASCSANAVNSKLGGTIAQECIIRENSTDRWEETARKTDWKPLSGQSANSSVRDFPAARSSSLHQV